MKGSVIIHQLVEKPMIDDQLNCFTAHRCYVAHTPDNLWDETIEFTVDARVKQNLDNIK